MTNDIVDELRTHLLPDMLSDHSELFEKAATEIERLRRERLEWFIVARQLKDALMAKQEVDEALNDYLRIRGRLEDPRDAAEEASSE